MAKPILCAGYPSLDHIAAVRRPNVESGTRIIHRHWTQGTFGGCAANVAVALRRLGIASSVNFALGDDPASRGYLEHLRREGVDTSLVEVRTGETIPRSYFFLEANGAADLYFHPAACQNWPGPAMLDLNGVRWLVLTVGPPHATLRLASAAKNQNIPLIWQLKRDREAFPEASLTNLLSAAEIIFANEGELLDLCTVVGVADEHELLRLGPEAVVVTLGDRGARITHAAGAIHIEALPVRVVDATGAGDGFTAGFLFGSYYGLSKVVCGQLGAVLASFVVEAWGCQEGLPHLEAVRQRYREAYSRELRVLPARSVL